MYKPEEHEKQITELAQLLKVDGVDQAKVSLILQSFRDNYTEVNTKITDADKKLSSLNELNEGLRNANMQLLTKLSIDNLPDDKKPPKEETPKETKSL